MQLLSNKIIVLIYLFSSCLIFSQKNDTIKYWSNADKLKITDFKSNTINNAKMSASSNLSLRYSLSEEFDSIFYIESVFNRYKSYFIDKKEKSQWLLKHEQLHFDILEVFARRFRKKIFLDYYNKGKYLDDDALYSIYLIIYRDYIQMSEEYDKETNHSINKLKQEEWNIKIAKELKDLVSYSHDNYIKLFEED